MSRPRPLAVCAGLLIGLLLLLPAAERVRFDETLPVRAVPPPAAAAWRAERIAYCHAPGCLREVAGAEAEGTNCAACGGALFGLSPVELDLLPRDTLLHKARFLRGDQGPPFVVTIVISSRERSSIHRPEVCLVGQGAEVARSFVHSTPRPNGPPLRMTVLEMVRHIRRADGTPATATHFYAYWFAGSGHETPSHYQRMAWMAFDRIFRGTASRWAYIAIAGNRDPEGAYLADLDAFAAALAPGLAP